MFKFNKCPFSFVFAIWLTVLSGSVLGDALTVRVQPHKSVVMVGEPVIVSATVVNQGSEPVTLIHHNAPTLFHTPFSVVALRFGAEEEQLKEWSDGLRPVHKTKPKLLPPGDSITIDLIMLFNREDGFFAHEPGKYWISGRVATPGNRVEVFAPPVEIEVREPSRSDKAAWEWLNAHKEEYGRLVQVPWGAKLSDEFMQECDRLCNVSQSRYIEYLALFLSRSYREGPKKDAAEAARFAEIAKSRASSEKVRTEALKAAPKNP